MPIAASEGGACVDATADNAYSGDYSLARFLYVYVNKAPNRELDPLTREFMRFVLSRNGEEVVIKDGYFPIPPSIIKDERSRIQ